MEKTNKKNHLATLTVLSAVTAMMLTMMMTTNYDNAYAKYERNQALSQVEECGNGLLPLNILCQDLASELQGDGNAVNIIGVQSASESAENNHFPPKQPHESKQQVFYAVMDGEQIPPCPPSPEPNCGPIETPATGFTVLKLDKSGKEMSYKVYLYNIENVVAMHIHLGMPGEIGEHVVTLCGMPTNEVPCSDGTNPIVIEGTFTSDNFENILAGQPMSALVKEIKQGNTYVNVHTNPGYPSGEIRGEILVP
jgi:hypothetical protein